MYQWGDCGRLMPVDEQTCLSMVTFHKPHLVRLEPVHQGLHQGLDEDEPSSPHPGRGSL